MGAWLEGMCDEGKHGLGKDPWGVQAKGNRDHPQKRSTVKQDEIALKELYHNPDPLVRLIGEANETDIIIENKKVKGLIDSGAQVSSILDTFASKLGLKVVRYTPGFRTNRGWTSTLRWVCRIMHMSS